MRWLIIFVLINLTLCLFSISHAQNPSFVMELVTDGLPVTSSNIAVAPPSFGDFGGDIFVTDVGSPTDIMDGQILRVTPAGEVHLFVGASPEMPDPAQITFSTGGPFGVDLYANSNQDPANLNNGIISRISPDGTTTYFGNPTPPGFSFGGGGIALSIEGPFGTNLYSGGSGGSPGDAISFMPETGGDATLFYTTPGHHNGGWGAITFGSGQGGFGTDLYAALHRAGGSSTLPTGIYVLDSDANITELVTEIEEPLIEDLGCRFVFGPGGDFGFDIYTQRTGQILTVDASGQVEVFLEGFASSPWLAFAGQDTLYALDAGTGHLYRILHVSADVDTPTGLSDIPTLQLAAPQPNPVWTSAQVRFSLARPSRVDLSINSVSGRRIRNLVRGELGTGDHVIEWNRLDDAGTRMAAGVYVIRIVADDEMASQKLIVAE